MPRNLPEAKKEELTATMEHFSGRVNLLFAHHFFWSEYHEDTDFKEGKAEEDREIMLSIV